MIQLLVKPNAMVIKVKSSLVANGQTIPLNLKTGEPLSETVQVRGDSGAEFRKGSFKLQPPEEIDVKNASPWRSYQFSH